MEGTEAITKRLDVIISLMLKKEGISMGNSVILLSKFGINNQEIADMIGSSRRSVEVMKSNHKKKK